MSSGALPSRLLRQAPRRSRSRAPRLGCSRSPVLAEVWSSALGGGSRKAVEAYGGTPSSAELALARLSVGLSSSPGHSGRVGPRTWGPLPLLLLRGASRALLLRGDSRAPALRGPPALAMRGPPAPAMRGPPAPTM